MPNNPAGEYISLGITWCRVLVRLAKFVQLISFSQIVTSVSLIAFSDFIQEPFLHTGTQTFSTNIRQHDMNL